MPSPPARPRKRKPARATPATHPAVRTWDIDCRLAYELDQPTHVQFLIHAWQAADQEVLAESLVLPEGVHSHLYQDPVAHHRFLRVDAPKGTLTLHYRASVRVAPRVPDLHAAEWPVQQLPDEVMHHLMPTRYCESDLLARAAHKLFGQLPPGHGRVQAICDWIHAHIDYATGSTNSETTACEVFWRRVGVCRDFAHLGVSFCRALNIPARLAVGYARFDERPADFHAVFEAHLQGQWVMFDATRLAPVAELVRIASGRDAKDLAFATWFGAARMLTMAPCVSPRAVPGPSGTATPPACAAAVELAPLGC